ncbi:DUF1389 domain-containing protein [Chlamydia vaughanii]|uniref:DUF1389 domain-containing protein n=1 Tax=Chlamydia vaughanii TaxID=3112552 RepID=UPI0032B11741
MIHPSSNTSLVTQHHSDHYVIRGLREHALKLSLVVFSLLAIAIITAVACGVFHPAALAAAVFILALVLPGVLLAMAVRSFAKLCERPHIPTSLVFIMRKYYPRVITDICLEQRLTIQELRKVLDWVLSKDFQEVPKDVGQKINNFGLNRLQQGCKGFELIALDDLLVKYCPAYFIKKLIMLGDPQVVADGKLPPEIYWSSPLGFTEEDPYTVFEVRTWLFARVVTEIEYDQLLQHMITDTWEEAQDIITKIQARMQGLFLNVESQCPFQETEEVQERIRNKDWFLRLCYHGVSWDQLQLFNEVGIFVPGFIEVQEEEPLDRRVSALYPHIHENDENYDPKIALLTWKDYL